MGGTGALMNNCMLHAVSTLGLNINKPQELGLVGVFEGQARPLYMLYSLLSGLIMCLSQLPLMQDYQNESMVF